MEYRAAIEVEKVGREIIEQHHAHLLGVTVVFCFMDTVPKSKGKEVWGRAKKITGLPAFLAQGVGPDNTLPEHYSDQPNDFFVIEIAEEVWDGLKPKGRRALVDHELSHLDLVTDEETGTTKLAIVGHDVTEFESILRRHGLWHEPLKDFVEAGAEQLTIDDAVANLHDMGAEMSVGFAGGVVDRETGEILEEVRTS